MTIVQAHQLRLYDNTRISDFKRCPRYFYFRHILGWSPNSKATALIFGGAWHAAQEVIWHSLITERMGQADTINLAYKHWLAYWTESGLPGQLDYEQEQELAPRTPTRAYEMIQAYVERRYKELTGSDMELVSVEKPFVVPLDPADDSLFYIGKIDKIVKSAGHYRGIEHKTTTAYKKGTGNDKFRSTFLDSFSPNSQVDGYLYVLHLTFPGHVGGVWIDAALVHKMEDAFTYIPVERQLPQLNGWLWEVRAWIDLIEANKAALEHVQPTDTYMAAFPKNTNSCFDFSTSCTYLGLCKAWANPAGHDAPAGFTVQHWDPLDFLDREEVAAQIAQRRQGK